MNTTSCRRLALYCSTFTLTALFAPHVCAQTCEAPAGIVSWWPADGGTTDIRGENSGANLAGQTFAAGAVGQAFSFDGTSWMSSPTTGLPTGNSGRTLELWAKVNDFVAGEVFFAGYGGFGLFGQSYQLGTLGNLLFFSQWGGAVVGPALQAGRWYHIAVTNTGNMVTLYLDGVVAARGNLSINTASNTQFLVGSLRGDPSRTLNGLIDDVAIYDHALSAAEVRAIFLAGGDGKCAAGLFLNGAPNADAGPDQSVDELISVTLNGGGSSDPENDPLTYHWIQTAGPGVTLTSPSTATPSFQAPAVSAALGSQVLTFELTVSDGLTDAKASVNITVKHVNQKPVADAGLNANVREGVNATLDGSQSYDPDNDTLTYQWSQISGSPVTLSGATTANASFVVPLAGGDPVVLQLVVNDAKLNSDPATVTVTPTANNAPLANAGDDITDNESNTVVLNGTGSSDPDGDGLTYQWTQTGGPTTVTLSDRNSAAPSFSAPAVLSGVQNDYTFSLLVTDGYAFDPKSSVPDTVTVHVLKRHAPPQCTLAQPSVAQIWPPNHILVPVEVKGVFGSDARFTKITLNILGVTQDEPVDGTGDGDTSPDAVIQMGISADSGLLRAERKGNGDGRVYRISFGASDGWTACTGSVKVSVPRDRKGTDARDSGQTVDSTRP